MRTLRHLTFLLAVASPSLAADPPLTTLAERSGFKKTGRYDEVIALCDAFAKRYADAVRCIDFGTTPEGRPMKALAVSRSGALTPDAARAKGVPVVLIQGGIHAGEIDGKDAGFLALRQALDGEAAKVALEKLVLVFVPVFNIDGHERFGAWNRPNQRGPAEMGWRTTAQNYNLNRDYAKADAPEMQAMLRLVGEWDPLACVDLHVTDGAQFEHDIAILVEPNHSGDEALRVPGRALRDGVIARLAAAGSLPLPYYPSFVETDNPQSGIEDGVPPPRFSNGYFPLRNRLAMLVETHSWKDYPKRVRLTRDTVVAVLELVAAHGTEWQRAVEAADRRAEKLGGAAVPLDYKASDKARTVAFRGYAYERKPSEISGALMTRYDESKPQVWNIPLRDEVVPNMSVQAPAGGYLVPPAHAEWVENKLKQHGMVSRRLTAASTGIAVEVFRADNAKFGADSVEGHQRVTLTGSWNPETRNLPAGSLFVPIAQPKARLVIALLEPQAPDALVAWGAFNNAFERKEYMEPYVAEAVARDMLAKNASLKQEFENRLKSDPEFAKSPQARLDFFYSRHSSWDAWFGVYPIVRIDREPR